jgi:hypothetical protein
LSFVRQQGKLKGEFIVVVAGTDRAPDHQDSSQS